MTPRDMLCAVMLSASTNTLLGFDVVIIEDTIFPSGAHFTKADITPIYEIRDEVFKAEKLPDLEYRRGPKPLPFDMTLKRNRRRFE